MNKKYLLKGFVALFVGVVTASCSHDLDGVEEVKQNALDNAQAALGFYIPADQDWVMSSMANANLTIQGEVGQTYTVKFYSNNPLTDDIAYILDMKTVQSGENYVSTFRYPSAMTSFFVGLTNDDEKTVYKTAEIVNGSISGLKEISDTRNITRTSLPNHNLWGDPEADGGTWNWNVPPALTAGQKLRVKAYFQANPNLTYVDPHLKNFFVQQVYKGNPQTKGAVSPEQYQSANNGWVIGSDHMDKLTVGTGGEGAESENFFNHVYNFNFGEYNGGSTTTVLNTGASTNDYTAANTHQDQIMLMVDSKTDCVGYWNSDGSLGHNDRCALAGAEVIDAWAEQYGNNIGEAVVDGWNRSFVGLDFDQVVGDDVYAKGVSYQDENGNWQYDANRYAMFEFQGEYYHFLRAETNMYCADRTETKYGGVQNYNDRPSDDIIEDLISLGYLPYTSTLKDWVKVGGGRDYYYSDWIVTLTPAEKIGQKKEEKQIWSYAFEDSNLKSDYDLNDVVLKVQETLDGTQLKVTLVAAGCEYDNKVYLNGTVISWNGKEEVHDVLGGAHEATINTGWTSRVPAVVTYISKPANYDPQTAAWTIVPSGGDMKDLHIGLASTGEAPTGIVVPYDWAWPRERINICDAYRTTDHSFARWARTTAGDLRTSTSDWYKFPDVNVTMK